MKTSSAKAKGRRAVQELAEYLLAYAVGINDSLTSADFIVKGAGATGEDLTLSTAARKLYPFTFEVKNQETISIWKAIKQSESHAEDTLLVPVLAFKRNGSNMYVTLRLCDFLHSVLGHDETRSSNC